MNGRTGLQDSEVLRSILRRIDGRGYKAYKDIEGAYDFGHFRLSVDHVQGDPFASPSRLRVRVGQDIAGFPLSLFKNRSREIALRDYLTRRFDSAVKKYGRGIRGTGGSGTISIDRPGQEILERTSLMVNEDFVEARFVMGLPAFGRRIAGHAAEGMFFDELPRIVPDALSCENLSAEDLEDFIHTHEDADSLREQLRGLGLVAFVADGSVLPRASGVDPRPLSTDNVVSFQTPPHCGSRSRCPTGERSPAWGSRKG